MNLFQDAIVRRHVALFISASNLLSFFRLDVLARVMLHINHNWTIGIIWVEHMKYISQSRNGICRVYSSYPKATESFRSRRSHCPIRERDLHFGPKQSWLKIHNEHKAHCMVFSGCQTLSILTEWPVSFIFMARSGRRLPSEKDIGIPSLARMFGLRVDDPNFFFVEDN